jgi:hypothetical protein
VPQAVFCLLTALQFHELTTQLPRQVWIAMPRGSHVPRIDYPPIKMVQMTGDVYTEGIEDGRTRRREAARVRRRQDRGGLLQAPQQDRLDVALEALKDVRAKHRHRQTTCGATRRSAAWPM